MPSKRPSSKKFSKSQARLSKPFKKSKKPNSKKPSKTKIDPKKSLSQNFLVDNFKKNQILDRFTELVKDFPDLPILEVGPGQGDLTAGILSLQRLTWLVELDSRSVEYLQANLLAENLQAVLLADIMELLPILGGEGDYNEAAFQSIQNHRLPNSFILLSNLPYHIGSRLLIDLAVYLPSTPFAVILQKEVVNKTSFNSKINFFGACLNLFYHTKSALQISPNCFYPQPKVWSALLFGRPKSEIYQALETRIKVKNFLKSLFAMPNKTIFNNLKQAGWEVERVQSLLARVGLNEKSRISWENYTSLVKANFTKDL